MSTEGKNILFIAPIFHDYHTLIVEKLEQMGHSVTFAAERDYSWRFKVVNNFLHRFLPTMQRAHYRRIDTKDFDTLFVIRGYMLPIEFVERFKADNPHAKTVMYQWDSNRTNPFAQVVPYFDIVKSFDYQDCNELPNVGYLPLFYTDDVRLAAQNAVENPTYDFFFMGTYMPERYEALLKFKESIRGTGYRLKSYIYIPETSLKKEQLKGVRLDMSIVSTTHMPRAEYLSLLNDSRVVVDVSNPRQTGLAMRIIEALASRRKILTANKFIVNEPFYNPQNIAIFDIDNPMLNFEFISSPFQGTAEVLVISDWLSNLFNINIG